MTFSEEIIDYHKKKLLSFYDNILDNLKKNDINKIKLLFSELLNFLETISPDTIYKSPDIHLSFIYFLSAIFNIDRDLFENIIKIGLKYFPDSVQLIEMNAKKLFLKNNFGKSLESWLQIESAINEGNFYPYFNFSPKENMLNSLKGVALCYEKLGDIENMVLYNDKLNYYLIIQNLRFEVSKFLFKY